MSCAKSEFLNKKSNSNIIVPTTLKDFNHLLDNYYNVSLSSCLPTISSDEYYYSSLDDYTAVFTQTEKNSFIWAKDPYGGDAIQADWNNAYTATFYCNVVLDGFKNLSYDDQESSQGKFVKGWAHFVRAFKYYSLVQIFGATYNDHTASLDLGIPIKTTPNIDEIKQRATIKKNFYNQIFEDIFESLNLLPSQFDNLHPNRPYKGSAYALLSRMYLNMHDYTNAEKYADNVLSMNIALVDYNTLDTNSTYPISTQFPETLYWTEQWNYSVCGTGDGATVKIDTNLISTYNPNDLRRLIFYSTTISDGKKYYLMKGGYAGRIFGFGGLAIDEMYLIKAECLARRDKLTEANKTLDELLTMRFKAGTYRPFTVTDKNIVLNNILMERRKELIFRGTRWADLKRLNQEGANITITRLLGGTVYTLSPNDPRYIMPIPEEEISLSHIVQNLR